MPDPFARRHLRRRLAGLLFWRYLAPMTERKTDPIRPTDDEARSLARNLISDARFAALGVIDPETGAPMVTRIALVPGPDGVPLTLISSLSAHTGALAADPAC